MILRKPYAFLIRNFRRFHFIIVLSTFYLIYTFINMIDVYNDLFDAKTVLQTAASTTDHYNQLQFILPIVTIISSIIIIILLKFKKKPLKLQVFNIVVSTITLGFNIISYNYLLEMQTKPLSLAVPKNLHDISIFIIILLIGQLFANFTRSIGFDVKSFDFSKELKELELEETDNEEVELRLKINSAKEKRKIRRVIRQAKYFYLENALVLNILMISFFSYNFYNIYVNKTTYTKRYKLVESISTNDMNIKFKDIYLTNRDSKNNLLDKNDNKLLILKLNIEPKYKEMSLDDSRITINIDGKKYYQDKIYKDRITDLGNVYNRSKLGNDAADYLFAYLIPEDKVNKKITLEVISSLKVATKLYPKVNLIPISYKNIDDIGQEKEIIKNENNTFNNALYKNINFTINELELNKIFVNKYRITYKGVSTNLKEYITPKVEGNYDKVMMKIKYEYASDEISNFATLNNYYGYITYRQGNEYITRNVIKEIKPMYISEKNVIYLEVDSNILNASEKYYGIDIRGHKYQYRIE